MKINKLIIVSILFSTLIYGQSGKISYNVAINNNTDNVDKNIKGTILKILEFAKKQQFELIFNKNQSSFKLSNKLTTTDEKDVKFERISRSAFTSPSDIFIDKQSKSIFQDMNDGAIIKEKYIENDWEITKETKKLDQYICYKAVLKEEYLSRNGDKNFRYIIAWFAPTLPYNYGPKNFYGLPGLILELTENKTTYLATKIELSKKEIQINFPKGKTITKEAYDKKLKAQMGM